MIWEMHDYFITDMWYVNYLQKFHHCSLLWQKFEQGKRKFERLCKLETKHLGDWTLGDLGMVFGIRFCRTRRKLNHKNRNQGKDWNSSLGELGCHQHTFTFLHQNALGADVGGVNGWEIGNICWGASQEAHITGCLRPSLLEGFSPYPQGSFPTLVLFPGKLSLKHPVASPLRERRSPNCWYL